MAKDNAVAPALGWFSMALGLSQLASPDGVADFIGVDDHESLMRAVGVREISAGIGILTQPFPVGWIWGRVGGDIMDISMLLAALQNERNRRERVAGALAAVLGITALDITCALAMSRQPRVSRTRRKHPMRFVKSVTVQRSPEELYAFWRDSENLPRFMTGLQSVRPLGEGRATWAYALPGRNAIETQAEITEDTPNRTIAWRLTVRRGLDVGGRVRFTQFSPGRGTVVRLELHFSAPAALGYFNKILMELPQELAAQDLRRFKQLVETGEILTNVGQSSGRAKYDGPVRQLLGRTVSRATQTQTGQTQYEREPAFTGVQGDGR